MGFGEGNAYLKSLWESREPQYVSHKSIAKQRETIPGRCQLHTRGTSYIQTVEPNMMYRGWDQANMSYTPHWNVKENPIKECMHKINKVEREQELFLKFDYCFQLHYCPIVFQMFLMRPLKEEFRRCSTSHHRRKLSSPPLLESCME